MTEAVFSELMEDFLVEAQERLNTVEEILLVLPRKKRGRQNSVARARRELHTLKGNAGMMGLGELQALAHELEDKVESLDQREPDLPALLLLVDHLRSELEVAANGGEVPQQGDSPAGSEPSQDAADPSLESARVSLAELDSLAEHAEQTVIFRNRVAEIVARGLTLDPSSDGFATQARQTWDEVDAAQEDLDKTLDAIQDHVLRLRLISLQPLFHRLRRIVHDESARERKQVNFTTSGGETPLDKTLLELANDVLGHLVRNAVIHGVESPSARKRAGKAPAGRVRVRAAVEGDEVRIDVEDDGAGVCRQALIESAIELGLDIPPDQDLHSLLFVHGLSTKKGADLSAGRGIGLAAVQNTVQRHGGRIEVTSDEGVGSRFSLRLPLSVTIGRALLVSADGDEYAIPISAVVQSLPYHVEAGHQINKAGVFPWKGSVVTMLDLGYSFGTRADLREAGYVVIIRWDGNHRAILVDRITGIQDIVVKGLDPIVGQPAGISGSTILGNGRVMLILDAAELMAIEPFVEDPK